jgi:hypothetical protein
MKTKKITHIVKKPWVAFLGVCFLIYSLNTACKKEEEKTNDIDITKWKWELRSVISGNKNLSPQKKDYMRHDAYLLEFISDSTFQMSTSVNFALGSYHIIKHGVISISNYHELTEVGTSDDYERELNDSLVSVFNKITSYEWVNNKLTFKAEDCKIIFDKE